MNRIIAYIRSKLSVKVSLWVVIFAAIIFNGALGFLFYQARETVRQEAINRATKILDNTSLYVETILKSAEVTTTMTEWLVKRHHNSADSMFVYSAGILINNPDLFGCSIAFEPYYFKEKGLYFSAYSTYDDGVIKTQQEGDDDYKYFYMDWYLMCKLLDRPCWTDPYVDVTSMTPNHLFGNEVITSYCRPLKDDEGNFYGVVAADISLDKLAETVSSMKPYPHSYSMMIGRGGTYFVHPDTTKVFYQTIFTESIEHPDTAKTALGHAMQRGEEGMKHMVVDGEDCLVFYKPLGHTGCSMAIVCPESDIFSNVARLYRTIIVIVCVSLLLMFYFFIHIITRELHPLRRLAQETKTIASGQFETTLPDLDRTDEIGQLSHSFGNMQNSLVKYIEELKRTTAQNAAIESDLRIANSIQMGMLPKVFPTKDDRDDVQIYASLTPAKAVGGDLFDFFFRDDKLFFCIGDVSGKGVPASLLMTVTRAVFRTVSAHESVPNIIVENLNNAIVESNETNMFVTLFVGVLDLKTGHLHYCNAGHDVPLLVGAGVGKLPCKPNVPVGLFAQWKYILQDTYIFANTTIFLYTDGLTEAENEQKHQFKRRRVINVAKEALELNQLEPRQLIDKMSDAVHQFVGEAEQSDDLTMMAIQYIKPEHHVTFNKTLVLPNDTMQLRRLAAFVNETCEVLGFSENLTKKTLLAIEEAVTNVMLYAYPPDVKGEVRIDMSANDLLLLVNIYDSGAPFDPTAMPEADVTLPLEQRRRGGLGIFLMRKLMDSVSYERIDDCNALTMIKRLDNLENKQ